MSTLRDRVIEAEVECWPEPLQFDFWAMVSEGNTHAFAQMCVSRQAPTMGLASDRQFNSSYRRTMENMSPMNRNRMLAIAKRAGINTDGKYYVSGLGRYNDPLAWCSTAEDVKAAAVAKRCTAHGPGIHYNAPAAEPIQKKRLADDIVDRLEKQYRSGDAKLDAACKKKATKRTELREKIVEAHGRKKA